MNWKHEQDALPAELEAGLRSLGVEPAPDVLWHRVVLASEELSTAPDALWARVAPAVRLGAEPARRRPLPLLARPLATAAALLLLVGSGFIALGDPHGAGALAEGPRGPLLSFYRSRARLADCEPSALSPVARQLAASLGAPAPR